MNLSLLVNRILQFRTLPWTCKQDSSVDHIRVANNKQISRSNESLVEMCNQPCKMKLRSQRNRLVPMMETSMKDHSKSNEESRNEAFDSVATGTAFILL